jgi:hypothetical protein
VKGIQMDNNESQCFPLRKGHQENAKIECGHSKIFSRITGPEFR